MVNVSNGIAAVISFFIGLVMLYVFNTFMTYLIDLFEAGVLKVVVQSSYMIFVFLLMFYFPIMVLTAEDKQ